MANLTSPRIAAEALAILDAEGVAGFSMRNVARALGVTPMALYHHLPNKAALAALVIEAAQADMPPLDLTDDDWQENIWRISAWTRQASLAHPAVRELRRLHDVWIGDFQEMANAWMTNWQRSGLDDGRALRAATTSSAAISGLLSEELGQRRSRPNTRGVPSMPGADLLLDADPDVAQLYELGVRSIVEGVHARLLREQTAASLAR